MIHFRDPVTQQRYSCVRHNHDHAGRPCPACRVEEPADTASCGLCKMGGRLININKDCTIHGDHDGLSR